MTAPSASLAGVWPAALTPLNEQDEPDAGRAIARGEALLAEGSDGLAILGTTGEANSIGIDARIRFIGEMGKHFPSEKLLVGAGAPALADAVRLTRASLDAGVMTVLILPPFYYRPANPEGVYDFFCRLVDQVGSAALRLYLYNFPQLTGFAFPPELVRRLRATCGLVIEGVKDSSGDFDSMKGFLGVPDFAVFSGTEALLLDILQAGGVGTISAGANVTAPLCREVYDLWKAGDEAAARDAQTRLTARRKALQGWPMIPALRSLITVKTGDQAWGRMLPPFRALDDAALAELAQLAI